MNLQTALHSLLNFHMIDNTCMRGSGVVKALERSYNSSQAVAFILARHICCDDTKKRPARLLQNGIQPTWEQPFFGTRGESGAASRLHGLASLCFLHAQATKQSLLAAQRWLSHPVVAVQTLNLHGLASVWFFHAPASKPSLLAAQRWLSRPVVALQTLKFTTSSSIDTCDLLSNPDPLHDVASYASLLQRCGVQKALSDGKRIHHHMVQNGFAEDSYLVGLLIQMYGKCGAVEQALELFMDMLERTPFSWNFIIRACMQHGKHQVSLHLFDQMLQEGAVQDKFTYVCALSACAGSENLFKGKQIYAQIVNSKYETDTGICTGIVNMYAKCGSLNDAEWVFDEMYERDVVAWNAMLAAYSHHGQGIQAIQLLAQMQQQGILPNKVTLISSLDACSSLADLQEGRHIHMHALSNNWESDKVLGNALLDMYGKCGFLNEACDIFEQLSVQNVVSWTSMIASCAEHGQRDQAFQLFRQMHEEGVLPGKVTFTTILSACRNHGDLATGEQIHLRVETTGDAMVASALVSMYGRCGNLDGAWTTFKRAHTRDLVLWNSMITVCAQHELGQEAIQLLHEMHWESLVPNSVTFIGVLAAVTSHTGIGEGKKVHACIIVESRLAADVIMANALISMYARCGSPEDAWSMFSCMPERDVVSWNTIIGVLALYGRAIMALRLFDRMLSEGVAPDKATFISVLEAYAKVLPMKELSHSRTMNFEPLPDFEETDAVKHGKFKVIEIAENVFNGLNEHDIDLWNSMLAVYVEHGQWIDALLHFEKMRWEGVMPNPATFTTLLSACTSQAYLAEGKRLLATIANTEFESDVALGIAIISMYGRFGFFNEAQECFENLPHQNVVSWSSMIAVCFQSGLYDEAHKLFLQLHQTTVLPNKVTYAILLGACASQGVLEVGKRLHTGILRLGFVSDVVTQTALIDMYAKCGSLHGAQAIFHKMQNHDLFLWNTMITLYGQHGLADRALELLDEMQDEGVKPDKVTFVNVLTACCHSGLISEAFRCFDSMINDFGISYTVHFICMVDLLGRAGQLDQAESLISEMPCQPTGVSFLALLGACKQKSDVRRAEWLVVHLLELDPDNAAPYVLLSNMYSVEGEEVYINYG